MSEQTQRAVIYAVSGLGVRALRVPELGQTNLAMLICWFYVLLHPNPSLVCKYYGRLFVFLPLFNQVNPVEIVGLFCDRGLGLKTE